MSDPAKKIVTYEDLYRIPENMTGEIIDGELIVTPRPSRRHNAVTSRLGYEIGPPYDFGRGGGPGGWVILVEPEIGLGEHIIVPDLAGWKAERFPWEEDHNWIGVAPDWVCEVSSPSTVRLDRTRKMAIYARHGVGFAWLIDPLAQLLEAYRFEAGRWVVWGAFGGDEKVRVEPFAEIEIDLAALWGHPPRGGVD